jgi:ADP-ribose pyrophosphatase YjhB (NUDIX family)
MSAGHADRTLLSHLSRCEPLTEEVASWFDGHVRLRLRGYLADQLPPLEYVTSSRCLVFRYDVVLVQRDKDSTHILPGGRREAEESPEETLHREVLEETGWALADPILIGFLHFCHLTPKPLEYKYPYPDFVQVVYMANAVAFMPDARLDDGYEVESVFRSIAEVQSLTLPASQRLFLDAALRLRGSLS